MVVFYMVVDRYILIVFLLYIEMRIVYQLIENYLSQKVPSILISIDEQAGSYKYIINVPPTHQRFISNHKMKFQKGARYFFTKTSTQTIAGLTGMMLTMFENGFAYDSKLFIDDKMYEYLEAMRYKMGFKLMPYAYCSWSGNYRLGIRDKQRIFDIFGNKQEYFKIFANLQTYIEKNLKDSEINDPLVYYDKDTKTFKDEQIRFIPFSIQTNGEVITNFICVPNKLVGKVNSKKLKDLGIEPRKIGQLMKTGKLTLDNGQILTVEDVKQPDQPSPNFIILHFNCQQSVKEILSHPILNKYLNDKQNLTQSVLYIVEERDIALSEDFKVLVNKFDQKTEHVVYNRHFKNKLDKFEDICQTSPHMDLVSQISEEFPETMVNLNSLQSQYLKKHYEDIINIENVFPNKKFHCYKRCYEMIIAPTKSVTYQPLKAASSAKKSLESLNEQLKQKLSMIKKNPVSPQSFPEGIDFKEIDPNVVFLGTGSMMPSKHRNVSCIFIDYIKDHSMMFDCGEGSYYQLFNHYGPQIIDQVVLSLRIIFITHIHSDHNLGILDLISQRNRLLKKYGRNDKLFLIIPFNVLPWFHSYVEKVENLCEGCDLVFLQWIKNEPLTLSEATMSKDERKLSCTIQKSQMMSQNDEKIESQENMQESVADMGEYYSELESKLIKQYTELHEPIMKRFGDYLQEIGVTEFLPVPVVHCPQSHGIVVTHKSKVKISYSGDTIPVPGFTQAAKNSTILIHQATFGDDLVENAKQNMHTTVGQAIDIGIKSKSWKTALTHFSQRYKSAKDIVEPTLYKMSPKKYEYALNHSIICFDHMQMKLSQTPKLPQISRAIASMIPSEKTDE